MTTKPELQAINPTANISTNPEPFFIRTLFCLPRSRRCRRS